MPSIFWTLLLATGIAAPLFKYPMYAFVVFAFTVLWNHLFPISKPDPEVLLLPTKKPYLTALKPLENPETVEGDHCPTCWDVFDATKAPTKLSCGHVFCNEDILEWINSGKNTCPVCKKVLFQQPRFQGNDAIAEKVHKARMCFVAISLLTTVLRQVLGFIARHPVHFSQMRWRWDYLNPLAYLTTYGPWYKNTIAIAVTAFDIMQLLSLYWGYEKYGPEWFKMFPGHWSLWVWSILTSGNQIREELDKTRHFAWVAWRICLWRWEGSPGAFIFWGATVVPAVKRAVEERAGDLVVKVVDAWDEHGERVHAMFESLPV